MRLSWETHRRLRRCSQRRHHRIEICSCVNFPQKPNANIQIAFLRRPRKDDVQHAHDIWHTAAQSVRFVPASKVRRQTRSWQETYTACFVVSYLAVKVNTSPLLTLMMFGQTVISLMACHAVRNCFKLAILTYCAALLAVESLRFAGHFAVDVDHQAVTSGLCWLDRGQTPISNYSREDGPWRERCCQPP
jgi:hypothetical protein